MEGGGGGTELAIVIQEKASVLQRLLYSVFLTFCKFCTKLRYIKMQLNFLS